MQEIVGIKQRIDNLQSKINQLEGKLSLVQEQYNTLIALCESLKKDKNNIAKAIELVNLIQTSTVGKTKEAFESIVTFALQYIYSPEYSFNFVLDRRGAMGTLDYNIVSPKCKTPHDPLDSEAGGILDVVSLALRVALLDIAQPKCDGPIILDESTKHLSAEFLSRASQFLAVVSERFQKQIILVTHQDEYLNYNYNTIKLGE